MASLPEIPKPDNILFSFPENTVLSQVCCWDINVDDTNHLPVNVCLTEGPKGFYPVKAETEDMLFFAEGFPSKVRLKWYVFWHRIHSEVVQGPQKFSREVTTKQGMTSESVNTMEGELGMDIKGVNAKISASSTQTLTLSLEKEVKFTHEIEVPKDQDCLYHVWQLWNRFEFVDENNLLINWDGHYRIKGKAAFQAVDISMRVISDIMFLPFGMGPVGEYMPHPSDQSYRAKFEPVFMIPDEQTLYFQNTFPKT